MSAGSYKNLVRRAVQVGVVFFGLALIAVSVLTTLGAERYVTGTVLPRVGARLGASITAGDVGAVPGRVVLRDVALTPAGRSAPIAVVHEVDAYYSIASLLSDERLEVVRLRGVDLRLDPAEGLPAVRDLVARVRHVHGDAPEATARRSAWPDVSLREIRVTYDDPAGLHARARVDAALHGRHGRALVRGLRVWGAADPMLRARAATIDFAIGEGMGAVSASLEEPAISIRETGGRWEPAALVDRAQAALDVWRAGALAPEATSADGGGAFRIEVHRGRAEVLREGSSLVTEDVHGWVAPDAAHRVVAARLAGKIGPEATWEVEAEGDLVRRSALGHVRLAELPLPVVLPLLPHVAVDWTAATRLSGDTDFKYEDAPGRLALDGRLRAEDLSVTSAMIASEPLRDLDVEVAGRGALWLRSRELAVSDARLSLNGIPLLVHGDVARSGGLPRITADLTLPPTPCSSLLRSMPTALVAHLGGLELDGVFGADLHVVLDLERPEHTDVRFDVGN